VRTTAILAVFLALATGTVAAQARGAGAASPSGDVRLLGQAIEETPPAPFRSIPRARFRAEVDSLARRAPSLSRDQLLVELLRVLASLGPRNGHTGLFPLDPAHERELHLYPLRLYDFADGLFVVDDDGAGVVGSKVVAVAGMPTASVLARVRPLVPRDNASSLRGLAPHYLLVSEVLDGLGIAKGLGPLEFTVEDRTGARRDVSLVPVPGHEYVADFNDALHGHYPSILPAAPRPLYLSGSARPIWSKTLAGGRAVYVGFNAVESPPDAFMRRLTRAVAAQRVRRVVVDVRLNGGGDNRTYWPLTNLLSSRAVNGPGRLYLLVGRATFSAAANFAAEVERSTRAVVVGEPTGGGVETYGDTVAFALPSVGLTVHVATRYHERKRNARDRRLAVEPDVPVALASAAYFAGRDPVLERALRGL